MSESTDPNENLSTSTGGSLSTADPADADRKEVTVNASYEIAPKENTYRVQKIKDSYGIDFDPGELTVIDDVTISLAVGEDSPGQIVFATGSSGAGKTTYCRDLAEQLGAVNFEEIREEVPEGTPIIEALPDDLTPEETQRYFSMFGLGEAHLNLRSVEELSDGQRYRFLLAYAATRYDVIFADEYCATLDRETAKTISYSLRRQIDKGRLDNTFIFATTHRDILADLRPDWLLDFDDNEVRERDAEADSGNVNTETAATETSAYRSHSRINSNLPTAPKRIGRSSRGGITSDIR